MFASVSVFRGTLKAKANGRETVLKDISKYKYHAGKDYSRARLKLKAIDGKALLKNIFKVHDNGKDYSCPFFVFGVCARLKLKAVGRRVKLEENSKSKYHDSKCFFLGYLNKVSVFCGSLKAKAMGWRYYSCGRLKLKAVDSRRAKLEGNSK